VAGDLIYAFRVMRLPLLDAGGAPIGKIEDLVVVPGRPSEAPRVVGFVASSQRRRIFVNAARVAELDSDGARLRSWDVDLNPFKPRAGEVLIGAELINRSVGDETVSDVALKEVTDGRSHWEIAKVRLARRNLLRRRPSYRLVDYDEVPTLFAAPTEMAAEAARLRDMHPSDVAAVVRALPLVQRRQLAEAMDSTSNDSSACSTRWSTTTSPTCSVRCRCSNATRCSPRWMPTRPTSCGACCRTRRAPPAG
jgi:hypothetical protein